MQHDMKYKKVRGDPKRMTGNIKIITSITSMVSLLSAKISLGDNCWHISIRPRFHSDLLPGRYATRRIFTSAVLLWQCFPDYLVKKHLLRF